MNKVKTKLQEVIDFFELEEGYDKDSLITECICKIKEIEGYNADEIGLELDGKTLMVLQDFAEEFYREIIEGVCNVLESFKYE